MTELLDLFFIDPDPRASAQLRPGLEAAGLRYVGGEASADQALTTIGAMCPHVVVLDAEACADLAATVRSLLDACPAACVIVTATSTPPPLISRAVAAGARGFMLKPYRPQDLLALIFEAVENPRGVAAPRPREKAGRLFAVYSPKGGVGCTTVATNLAVAIASRPNTSVALIDLDLQFGDVGAALDLHSVNSIAEVLRAGDFSRELIDETFVRHDSGVRALLAPEDLGVVDTIETEQVVTLLQSVRESFDYVICDLWSSLDELTRGVMRIADRVVMVTTPEYPAVRDLQRVLKSVRADLNLDGRMLLVLNRNPGKVGLEKADVARVLGLPVAITIPSDGVSVTDAINRGLSLLDTRARVRIAHHYRELAALTTDPASVKISVPGREPQVQLSR